ncbi:MAG: TRAP transporter small permease [Burkholderiaceae bacterium]
MRLLLDRFYLGCGILSCISIVFIVAVVAAQVFLNTLDAIAEMLGLPGLGIMIPSYSMFSGYGLAFATFTALGPAIRNGAHIRVTLLQERLPGSVQRPLLVLIALVGTLIGALMTWAMLGMAYESWDFGDKSSGLVAVPLWVPQSMLCFGSFALFVACADLFFEFLFWGRSDAFNEPVADEGGA